MAPRRHNAARIKTHRNYEIEEAAEALGVTPQTVRKWIKDGLPALTEQRPYLVLGWQLKAYLKDRSAARKATKGDGEFYCPSCKARRNAALGMTEEIIMSNGKPAKRGFCEVCETLCHLFLAAGCKPRRPGSNEARAGTLDEPLKPTLNHHFRRDPDTWPNFMPKTNV
jgi:transposase-like protein